jgi:hypothetical protein
LSRQRLDGKTQEFQGAAMFHVASHALKAINRLKNAGFMIIGLGPDEWFHGFRSQISCDEFLSASALDDVIIPCETEKRQRCASAMIQAAAKWLLDLDRSFFISRDDGDLSEVEVTGCTPIRFNADPAPAESFPEMVDRILALNTASDERF